MFISLETTKKLLRLFLLIYILIKMVKNSRPSFVGNLYTQKLHKYLLKLFTFTLIIFDSTKSN